MKAAKGFVIATHSQLEQCHQPVQRPLCWTCMPSEPAVTLGPMFTAPPTAVTPGSLSMTVIRFEVDRHIALVTIDRPPVNAFNRAMRDQVIAALAQALA